MALFERIGKSVTDAGYGVAQQTKNFTEVNRINGLIADANRRRTALLGEIGQAYYARHKEDAEPEFSDQLSELRNIETQIETWSEQIKQIQGFTKCRNCGADIPKGAQFCSACGAKAEERRCPNCGRPIAEDVRFCVGCGAKLQTAEPDASAAPKSSVCEKCCPACGTRLSEEDRFCPECGTAVFA